MIVHPCTVVVIQDHLVEDHVRAILSALLAPLMAFLAPLRAFLAVSLGEMGAGHVMGHLVNSPDLPQGLLAPLMVFWAVSLEIWGPTLLGDTLSTLPTSLRASWPPSWPSWPSPWGDGGRPY